MCLILVISIIIFPALFSCATTQQKAASYKSRGITYGQKGEPDQAISDCNKAIEINPRSAHAYTGRGEAYNDKGDYDQAISDFNKALEIEPKFALAYYDRGRSYYFKKEYDKSWEDIKRAQDLGYKIPAEFLEDLRKASGRQD
jgi:tetratricopeptide (TPR) repeat protein